LHFYLILNNSHLLF